MLGVYGCNARGLHAALTAGSACHRTPRGDRTQPPTVGQGFTVVYLGVYGCIRKGFTVVLERGLRLYWKGVYGCIGKGFTVVLERGLRLHWKGVYGCIGKGFTVVLERGLRLYWKGVYGCMMRGLGLYNEGLRVGSWTLSMGAQNTMRK